MGSSQETKLDSDLEPELFSENAEQLNDGSISREERKLLQKIDFYVLPCICITYTLSQIDRTNISSAKIAGMAIDLRLVRNRYSVALLISFIPYVCSELPTTAIIRRVGSKILLTILIFRGGTVAMCFGFVKNFEQLAALQVLLGLFDGGFNVCLYQDPDFKYYPS